MRIYLLCNKCSNSLIHILPCRLSILNPPFLGEALENGPPAFMPITLEDEEAGNRSAYIHGSRDVAEEITLENIQEAPERRDV